MVQILLAGLNNSAEHSRRAGSSISIDSHRNSILCCYLGSKVLAIAAAAAKGRFAFVPHGQEVLKAPGLRTRAPEEPEAQKAQPKPVTGYPYIAVYPRSPCDIITVLACMTPLFHGSRAGQSTRSFANSWYYLEPRMAGDCLILS